MDAPVSPKRILLVEDEEALRLTLKLNFEMDGFVVTTASTGHEAIERMRGAHFDLVVMDVMLPGMDGYSVVESMRLEGDITPGALPHCPHRSSGSYPGSTCGG
jgi:two-component system alkaline phosphatase synthesis response regulator PhoP